MMDCLCPAPRTLACRVVLLDERELFHELQDNNTGQALLDVVFKHLDLLETAYFGLRYVDQDNQTHWLDAGKRLRRQLRGTDPHTFYFGVKFYAADPCKLLEEITRYQIFLQLKQDVLRGRLPVNFDLAAELAAYVLQSELGDYDPRRHAPGYVSEFRLLAHQTPELEARAAEIHRTLIGISPAQAELSYLDKVKWLDMYGVDLHPVLGEDSVEYFLGLAPSGLLLLRGKHTVANYYWPRVSKLYYKGRYFMLRVADKNNDTSTYGFESPTRAACRHLWRCCSDHHTFFRLQQTSPASADMFSLGSRLRNSGRGARPRPPPSFTRTPSRRNARPHTSHASLHDVPKLEDLRIKDCPEIKQPTSVHRPSSMNGEVPGCDGVSTGGPGGSPRSTRSAPARRPGLYSASPTATRPPPAPRHRSASVDSQSSNDSRSNRKHKHRSRRQQSDAESELSRGSGRSGRRHRRHRSRHKHESGSERDDSQPDTKEYELVDSESQWKEVLRQSSVGNSVQVANVRRSQLEPDTGTHRSSHRHRKHRKHRSRSGSPNDKKWLPSEVKQHLEFSLVDTTGMTEEQLKEIPYTVVQTSHARQTKLRTSSKHRQAEHGSLARREKSSSSHKLTLDSHNQGSLRSISSTLSSQRNSSEKHSRRIYPNYDETIGQTDDIFLSNNEYKGNVTPASINNNPYSPVTNSNSNSSSGELISGSARVSHEHTDSGLGADQDYAYSSERSSDSAKCGAGGSVAPVSKQRPGGGGGRSAREMAGARGAGYGPACGTGYGAGFGSGSGASARRPPAAPRAVSGSQRSLLSVASDSATARRPRDLAPRSYHYAPDGGFSLFRHASNNNILVGESGSLARRYARPSRELRELREPRDHNANMRTHSRLAHQHSRHDNTLDIILKPLIESTQ
ncbi:hypothetical protein O3G_MSEX001324 [Manduca sexta]|nr:hypothetical protein O3G_MSEX001324 [Manduca sexta]